MKMYIKAETQDKEIVIDYIRLIGKSGTEIFVDWDESEIARNENGFSARYKGISFQSEEFDGRYANGLGEHLDGATVDYIGVSYAESEEKTLEIDMVFDDDGVLYAVNEQGVIEKVEECEALPK